MDIKERSEGGYVKQRSLKVRPIKKIRDIKGLRHWNPQRLTDISTIGKTISGKSGQVKAILIITEKTKIDLLNGMGTEDKFKDGRSQNLHSIYGFRKWL